MVGHTDAPSATSSGLQRGSPRPAGISITQVAWWEEVAADLLGSAFGGY